MQVMIKTTSNYKRFRRSDDNRTIKIQKHRKLSRSIEKYGLLPYWPIVVRKHDGKLEIIDGQHRFECAMANNLPVHYVEMDSDVPISIPEINDTQKTWETIDYAELYKANGNENYAEALEFKEKHKIPIGSAFALLAGTVTFNNIEKAFKKGEFKIADREWAERVVEIYCPIVAISEAVKRQQFMDACMAVCRVEKFNASRLIAGCEQCSSLLRAHANRDMYLQMMEDIYNFRRKQLFPLRIEAMKVMRGRNATKPTMDDLIDSKESA